MGREMYSSPTGTTFGFEKSHRTARSTRSQALARPAFRVTILPRCNRKFRTSVPWLSIRKGIFISNPTPVFRVPASYLSSRRPIQSRR